MSNVALKAIASELKASGVRCRVVTAAKAAVLKPLEKWSKEDDSIDGDADGSFYYTTKAPGGGALIIALDDTGWCVVHERSKQTFLAKTLDGRFFATNDASDANKATHFKTAAEAWYALSVIWPKLKPSTMDSFTDVLPTNAGHAVTAAKHFADWEYHKVGNWDVDYNSDNKSFFVKSPETESDFARVENGKIKCSLKLPKAVSDYILKKSGHK